MPIVRYQRQQTISAIDNSALIKKASTDEVSGAAVAETIGQSVETLAKRYQEIKKQQDEITKVNKINEYDTEATNWLIDMQENKTFEKSYDLQKEYTDWHTNKVNNLTKDISNPQVKTALNDHYTDMSNNIKLKVSSFQVGQKKAVVDTAKQNALDISLKGVTTGTVSPYEAINLYKNKIGMLRAAKAISSDEETDKITKDGVSQIGETYLGRMINDNPSGALEQIKSDMWTDVLNPEAIVKLKDTATKMEKSKDIQNEKDKIEKELKYSEDIENTLLKSYQKGALTWKQIMDVTTPTDFNQWSSQGKNRHNSMIEKYTAIKKSEEERDKKANKEALKPENNALFNELYMRAETDWGDDNIPVEKKSY